MPLSLTRPFEAVLSAATCGCVPRPQRKASDSDSDRAAASANLKNPTPKPPCRNYDISLPFNLRMLAMQNTEAQGRTAARAVAVFCGSSDGAHPAFASAAMCTSLPVSRLSSCLLS